MGKLTGRVVEMVINPGWCFPSSCLLACDKPGDCASVAAALRALAERFDALALENYTPATLDA